MNDTRQTIEIRGETVRAAFGRRRRICVLSIACTVVILSCGTGLAQDNPTTQTLNLRAGWNLVSWQVELADPAPAAFEALFDPGSFKSIWTYHNPTASWRFHQDVTADLDDLSTTTLTALSPNTGYWIHVTQAQTLDLSGPPASGALEIGEGWNLVGFPGLRRAELEVNDIQSVFRGATPVVRQVWTYDATPSVQAFIGYDTVANPPLFDLVDLVPGAGYWVYAEQPVSLMPDPKLLVAQDYDLPDASNNLNELELFDGGTLDPNGTGANVALFLIPGYPERYEETLVRWRGQEDADAGTDLNDNGILDSSETQDTIVIPREATQLTMTVVNDGAGLTGYRIAAEDGAGDELTWLLIDTTQGSIGSEQDLIRLTVLRDGLVEGEYSGTLIFTTDEGTEKTFDIRMTVGDVEGDYRGRAVIGKINGEEIDTLPAIDLYLSLFKDSEGNLQGVVNSEKSLLFPSDFSISGLNFITDSNAFAVSGGYIMPLTAHNYPPFDNFDATQGVRGPEDFEWNDNDEQVTDFGDPDRINPFPFQLDRSVYLVGSRPRHEQLTGEYFETIGGAFKEQSLFLEGEFTLTRESFDISKKDPTAIIVTEPRPLKDNGETIITKYVSDAIRIESITVKIKISHARPSDLEIVMTAPDGQAEVLLFDNEMSEEDLDGIERTWFHDSRAGTGDATLFADFINANSLGLWTLTIRDNVPGEVGTFISWELQLGGTPAFVIQGDVEHNNSAGQKIAGADIFLSGSQSTEHQVTGPDGSFRFENLAPQTYSVTVQKAGFQTERLTLNIVSANPPDQLVLLRPLVVPDGVADFEILPPIGQAPLTFTAVARIGPDLLAGTVPEYRWSFRTWPGDVEASSPVSTQTAVSDTLTTPGLYHAQLEVFDTLGSMTIVTIPPDPVTDATARYILVHRRTDSDGGGDLIADPTFSGGGLTFFWPITGGGAVTRVEKLHGVVLNENFADAANFEFNRALTGDMQFALTDVGYDLDYGLVLADNLPALDLAPGAHLDRTLPSQPDGAFNRAGIQDRNGPDQGPNTDMRRFRMVVNTGGPLTGVSAAGNFQLHIGGRP